MLSGSLKKEQNKKEHHDASMFLNWAVDVVQW
jgi:hypothetical protein